MSAPKSLVEFQHRDWTSVAIERIAEGIERQMIWGELAMVCRLRFAPHVVTAAHAHPHEQITLVERGKVEFSIDGRRHVAAAGDILVFPPHCVHGATILDEEVVMVDIFAPVREDFLPSSGNAPRPGGKT